MQYYGFNHAMVIDGINYTIKKLKAMDDLNDSKSLVQDSKCYEQFKDVDDINDVVLWAQASRCYE